MISHARLLFYVSLWTGAVYRQPPVLQINRGFSNRVERLGLRTVGQTKPPDFFSSFTHRTRALGA